MTPAEWVVHMRARVDQVWPHLSPDQRIKVTHMMEKLEAERDVLAAWGRQLRAAMNPPPVNPGFACPRCRRTSYNPNDLKEGYCGACHDWTGNRK